jgi:DNA-binding CsgD family transcriptional regulator
MDERSELDALAAKCRQLASRLTHAKARTSLLSSLTITSIERELNHRRCIAMPTTDSLSADALTQGQIDCLLLVSNHFTSKEIASRLGISRHTVDQRVRVAMRTLGVKRRGDAARIVVERYGPAFQWGKNSPEPFVLPSRPAHRPTSPNRPLLPFATRLHPRNEMSAALRLAWIAAIAMAAAGSAGMCLAGLESLSHLAAHR